MHKDDIKNLNMVEEVNNFFLDLKNGFLKHKGAIFFCGFTVSLSALFLNIAGEDVYLKRIQALFLLLSSSTIMFLTFFVLKQGFKKTTSNLYQAVHLFFIIIVVFFIFNITKYIQINFSEAISYYFRYLLPALVYIFINITLLLLLKFLNKKNKDEVFYHETIDWAVLLSLNGFFLSAYMLHDFNFLETIKYIFSFNFHFLSIIYQICFAIYLDLFLYNRLFLKFRTKTMLYRVVVIHLILFVILFLPFIIKYSVLLLVK